MAATAASWITGFKHSCVVRGSACQLALPSSNKHTRMCKGGIIVRSHTFPAITPTQEIRHGCSNGDTRTQRPQGCGRLIHKRGFLSDDHHGDLDKTLRIQQTVYDEVKLPRCFHPSPSLARRNASVTRFEPHMKEQASRFANSK